MKLCEGDDSNENHVDMLTGVGTRTSIEENLYRYICYCLECIYALLIDEMCNIYSNPGFE